MHWYSYLAYSFGKASSANRLPQIGKRISRRPFQTPFAKPPGKGSSSSLTNVMSRLLNLARAHLLTMGFSGTAGLDSADVLAPGAGALILSLTLADGFGRFHWGL